MDWGFSNGTQHICYVATILHAIAPWESRCCRKYVVTLPPEYQVRRLAKRGSVRLTFNETSLLVSRSIHLYVCYMRFLTADSVCCYAESVTHFFLILP